MEVKETEIEREGEGVRAEQRAGKSGDREIKFLDPAMPESTLAFGDISQHILLFSRFCSNPSAIAILHMQTCAV